MEKTFREVIRDIKEGEVWRNSYYEVYIDDIGINIDRISKETINGFGIILDGKFKLQRKEYTFEEAFKAYEEGKEIESISHKYKKFYNADRYLVKSTGDWVENRGGFDVDEIRGKWYIND